MGFELLTKLDFIHLEINKKQGKLRQTLDQVDSNFAVIELLGRLRQLNNPICMITRFRMDAALYEPVQPVPGKRGRPRKKGNRLATLEKVAEHKDTSWKRLTVQEGYGEKKRDIEITTQTAAANSLGDWA